MEDKKISKLAITSMVLSVSSIFIWLFWIPGVVCVHIARRRIKANPSLRGKSLAISGLLIGYFFPVALLGVVAYLGGYFEKVVTINDQGKTVWVGNFSHDANEKNQSNRIDLVLTPITLNCQTVGTIESRDKNLRLVLKPANSNKEFPIWRYRDYGSVSKITVDENMNSFVIYYDYTLIRAKKYNAVVSLEDFKVNKHLVDRGGWCL